MKLWEWLGEPKNQQILMFIGGGAAGAIALVVPLLFQFGVFEPKPVPAKTSQPSVPATPVASATSPDVAVKTLVDILVQKEKADAEKARLAYKQELQAWEFAKNLHTVRGYQAYLSDYPKGEFSLFAKAGIDKLRHSVVVVADMPAINTPDNNTPTVLDPPVKKPTLKHAAKTHATHPNNMANLIVQCVEGTKLYVDGAEKGQINSALFGSLTISVPAGKHGLIVVSPQGVLQQQIEVRAKESRRINPPFCS